MTQYETFSQYVAACRQFLRSLEEVVDDQTSRLVAVEASRLLETSSLSVARAARVDFDRAKAVVEDALDRAEAPTDQMDQCLALVHRYLHFVRVTCEELAAAGEEASQEVSRLRGRVAAMAPPVFELSEPEPDPGDFPLLPESVAWAPLDRLGLTSSSTEVILVEARPDGLSKALQDAEAELHTKTHPGLWDIVIVVPEGQHDGFGIGTGSPHSSDYISPKIFNAKAVHLIGPEPEATPIYEGAEQARINAKAVISRGRYTPGGDCIGIGAGRKADPPRRFGVLNLVGLELRCCGRAAVLVNGKTDFILNGYFSHWTTEPAARLDGADLKWANQLHQTSFSTYCCSADLPGLKEHFAYEHGHASGFPSTHLQFFGENTGGQFFQFTERRSEVPDADANKAPIIIEHCALTNFGQNIGRAGSAITVAGAGRDVQVLSTVVVDDNPYDTPGQADNIDSTNYGCLVVWCPEDESSSYRHDRPGNLGNGDVIVDDCIFATRNPNRDQVKITDADSLSWAYSSVRSAGQKKNRGGFSLGNQSTTLPVVELDMNLEPPTQRVEKIFESLLLPTSSRSDYVEMAIPTQIP